MKPFDAGAFTAALETRRLGRGSVLAAPALASTNDAAWERAAAEPGSSAVVVADFQTAGRGRFGRAWEAPPGAGLLASVVVPEAPFSAARLSAIAAVAVAETLESVGIAALIQWPNDVYARDRKISGLLLEARDHRPESPLVVLGLGLNVAQSAEDFPPRLRATSIRIETGTTPAREALLARFLFRLESGLDTLRDHGPAALEAAYRARNRLLGRKVTILDSGSPLTGTALDLSPECGLSLRLAGGEVRRFAAEHVTIADTGDESI